jgi:sucrose-phosphate synthase
MQIAFFNPQGNFDSEDSYWTEHPDFGGQLVYVKELATALHRQGHEAVIFTRRMDDPEWPEFQEPEEVYLGSGVRIIRVDFGGNRFLNKEELWPYLKDYVKAIMRWYESAGILPDIVTTHYGDGGIAGALFEQKTGVPFTFTAHSLGAQKMDKLLKDPEDYDLLDQQLRFTVRLAAERTAMGRALVRMVSTVQEKEHQYLHPIYRDLFVNEEKRPFAIIPPGVNQTLFSPDEAGVDEEVRRLFEMVLSRDIHDSRRHLPIAIASSRLNPKKNVTGLVAAYAQNPQWQQHSNLMLAVRGLNDPQKDFGALKSEEQEQIQLILSIMDQHQLIGKISFINLSSQKELGAAYREVARRRGIFCLTSLYEPFGLATIEAMSCGVPVVVTANGGGQEILSSQGTEYGILVDPEDPEAIGRGAMDLLTDSERWEDYREKGLKRVHTTYTWDAAAKAYVEAIHHHLKKAEQDHGKKVVTVPELPDYFWDPTANNLGKLSWIRQAVLDQLTS